MRLKQESEKMMTVCAKKEKRENDLVFFIIYCFNVHRITLPRMSDNQSWLLGEQLDLLATTRVTTCTYAQLQKKKAFSLFSRVFRHVNT